MGLLNVRLNEGSIFYQSQVVGKQYLLGLDMDRLLAPLYEGVNKKSEHACYGGWESMEIKGHSVGHYLSAVSSMYAATKDKEMKRRMDYIVSHMAQLQREDGYLGGFSSAPFDSAFSGVFEVENFSLNGHWVPWYSIHKLYAGLIDAYLIGGNDEALKIVVKFANWAFEGSQHMSDEQFQKMLICEYGGMNEVMAEMYEITHDEKYLVLAKRFSQPLIIEPLSLGVDELQGKHANTQIPKVIGAAKLYEVTHEPYYYDAVKFFFDTVTRKRSFIIGGNSNSEHFSRAETEVLSRDTAETCNTYNMMKLAEYLFRWTKDVTYMDYYERALYNHILASQDPETGSKIYFTSLFPGHFKVYGTKEESFWCCTGTGMENPGRYNRQIFYKEKQNLYINLFIASTLVIEKENINLSIQTNFPSEDTIILKFNETPSELLHLKIRIPSWLSQPMSVTFKTEQFAECDNGYLTLSHQFLAGDEILIKVVKTLTQYTSMDDPHKIAFLCGPIVLAGALGIESFPTTDIVPDHLSLMSHPKIKVNPLISDATDICSHFTLIDEVELIFKGVFDEEEVILKPFYNMHHERYTVYFKTYTTQEFESLGEEVQDRDQLLFDKTIDVVKTGEQQSEIEHHFKGIHSFAGYLYDIDMWWRDARFSTGSITYEMEVDVNVNVGLMVSYYGLNGQAYDQVDRTFDIYINDTFFKRETLIESGEANVVDIVDEIPKQLLDKSRLNDKAKQTISICFKNTSDHTVVGGILEVRTIRLEQEGEF